MDLFFVEHLLQKHDEYVLCSFYNKKIEVNVQFINVLNIANFHHMDKQKKLAFCFTDPVRSNRQQIKYLFLFDLGTSIYNLVLFKMYGNINLYEKGCCGSSFKPKKPH